MKCTDRFGQLLQVGDPVVVHRRKGRTYRHYYEGLTGLVLGLYEGAALLELEYRCAPVRSVFPCADLVHCDNLPLWRRTVRRKRKREKVLRRTPAARLAQDQLCARQSAYEAVTKLHEKEPNHEWRTAMRLGSPGSARA